KLDRCRPGRAKREPGPMTTGPAVLRSREASGPGSPLSRGDTDGLFDIVRRKSRSRRLPLLVQIHAQATQRDLEQRVGDRQSVSEIHESRSLAIDRRQRDFDERSIFVDQSREEFGLIAETRGLDMEAQDVHAAVNRTAIVIAKAIAAGAIDQERIQPRNQVPVVWPAFDGREIRNDDIGLPDMPQQLPMEFEWFDAVTADKPVIAAARMKRSLEKIAGDATVGFIHE